VEVSLLGEWNECRNSFGDKAVSVPKNVFKLQEPNDPMANSLRAGVLSEAIDMVWLSPCCKQEVFCCPHPARHPVVTSRPPSLVGVLVGAAIATFKLMVEGLREPSYINAPTYLVVWSVPGRPPSRSRLLARVFVLPIYARQRQRKAMVNQKIMSATSTGGGGKIRPIADFYVFNDASTKVMNRGSC
jgi:hypothetical protein